MTDPIERQAAIDAIADYLSKTTYTSAISFLNTGALILAKVPSAQQYTPADTQTTTYRFGKWIEKEEDGYHGGGYTECSVCGQRYSWGGYFEANEFRYCPRCGHRMEVEEDE